MKIESSEFIDNFIGHDIIFLNECWISCNSKFELNGYKCYLKARKRKRRAKRDSGGLCLFVKNELCNFFQQIDCVNEDLLIFKISNAFSSLDKDIFLFFCYMRPLNSTRNNICDDLDVYDVLYNKITELRNNNEIIVIGDLNSRCSTLSDLITSESCSNFDPVDDLVSNVNCINEKDLLENSITVSRKNEDTKVNDFGHKLVNLCKVSGLLICNGRLPGDEIGNFTYFDKKGKSTVDFALVSKGLLCFCKDFCVHKPSAFSDHCVINLNLSDVFFYNHNIAYNDVSNLNSMNTKNVSSHLIAKYEINNDNMSNFVSNMNDEYVCSNLNSILDILNNNVSTLDNDIIDDCLNGLNHVLEYSASDFVKKTPSNVNYNRYRKNNNLWYDQECINKRKEFDLARDNYLHTLQDKDLKYFCCLRNAYRKLCRIKKRNFQMKKANDLVTLSKENSKLFWKKIKRKQKKNSASCDFHFYFKELFETPISNLSENAISLIQNNNDTIIKHDDLLDSDITMVELENAIKKLKNDKSPGFDNILNEFLKVNTPLFKTTLLSIFNVLYSKSYFPKAWSVGMIIPIFKKGNVNQAENYRGITLLSCVGKLFTSIINQRLNVWAELNNKFDKDQYGFRNNKSTIDAIFVLQNVVDMFVKRNKSLFVSFIDLKKAFDCVNHNAMWFKLDLNGISSKLLLMLKDMYSKIKLCVQNSLFENDIKKCDCILNIKHSYCISCNSDVFQSLLFTPFAGVFQGESLSPTIFSLFLNDINNCLQEDPLVGISVFQFYIALLLFADDMVLICDTREELQSGLNKLYENCNNWGLLLNVDKTKCLVFKKGGKQNPLDKWYYNGQGIETVTSFKYLGFMFACSGKFNVGINNVFFQGQRALFNMFSSIDNFDKMYFSMQISLFNSLVTSVLCYACEIWGFAEAKKIETLHLRFLKIVLKVKKSTPTCVIYKECNVYPLYLTRIFRIIKYWIKIVKLNDNDPLKILYLTSLSVDEYINVDKSSLCWANQVKDILYCNGFGYVWENQHLGLDSTFFSILKNRLIDSFWQSNNSEIELLSKNRLYRHLALDNIFYLSNLQNDFIRIALTKLRLGSHNLLIERGRWNNTAFENRKCLLCDEIEDEYHFVVVCTKFHDLRIKYLPKMLYQRPSMYKFVNFLNSKNVSDLRKIGLFLHHAFNLYNKDEVFA